MVSEVIRPAAIVPEEAARTILVELSLNSVHSGGLWRAEPSRWNRYDRPWVSPDDPGDACLLGSVQVAYGTPTKYEITIYRVSITRLGAERGCTVAVAHRRGARLRRALAGRVPACGHPPAAEAVPVLSPSRS